MTESTESVESTAASTATSTEPLRIAILAGGLSHERDVSLRSGHRVASVLKHLGHTVLVLDVDARTIASLRAFGPYGRSSTARTGRTAGSRTYSLLSECRTWEHILTVASELHSSRLLRPL